MNNPKTDLLICSLQHEIEELNRKLEESKQANYNKTERLLMLNHQLALLRTQVALLSPVHQEPLSKAEQDWINSQFDIFDGSEDTGGVDKS